MDSEEFEQLRQKKMQEQYVKALQAEQLEAQMKTVLRQILDDEAYERAMNVRISSPKLYKQLVALLAYLQQNNQIKGKVNDKQLTTLLMRVAPSRHDSTISFKRK